MDSTDEGYELFYSCKLRSSTRVIKGATNVSFFGVVMYTIKSEKERSVGTRIMTSYNPGPDFEEDSKNSLVDISLTDSTELWLIQWPINQLQPDDFDGKELSLKLHQDGQLASLESSSGKSYEVVTFAAQEPDATVFLSAGSKSKVVGKISRRVCLVRYPEPEELGSTKRSRSSLSSQRSGVSGRKVWNTHQSRGSSKQGVSEAMHGASRGSITSMDTMGCKSSGYSKHSKHKRRKGTVSP